MSNAISSSLSGLIMAGFHIKNTLAHH